MGGSCKAVLAVVIITLLPVGALPLGSWHARSGFEERVVAIVVDLVYVIGTRSVIRHVKVACLVPHHDCLNPYS